MRLSISSQMNILDGLALHHRRRLLILFIISGIIILITSHAFKRNSPPILLVNPISDQQQSSPSSNTFACSIRAERWIVITSIFYPTAAVERFLQLSLTWSLIVVADRKTPVDWLSRLKGNRSRVLFLSMDDQYSLNFLILRHLSENSYARKNVGYLVAIQCGAKIIFESDDDNLLEANQIYHLPKVVASNDVPWIAFHRQRSLFVNIYASFGHPHIWPRGFPVDQLRNVTEDGWHSVRRNTHNQTRVYIQQYLADLDPDVDALYRLTHPLSIGRIRFDRTQLPIVLEAGTFSPYNTQNTITHAEAFWGLLLPITSTFRVCDIWRSFWVQRLLWDIDGRVMFGTATVQQIRNAHAYLKDMIEEDQLYHQSDPFVRFLASWSSSLPTLEQRISQLSRDIAQAGFWKDKEIELIDAWIEDLRSVGYIFPSIVSVPPSSLTVTNKRAAICVTGVIECIPQAWVHNHLHLRQSLRGDLDVFLFLSSSFPSGPIPLPVRVQHARSYMNTTVTVLYEDRTIDPRIPANCTPNYVLPKHIYKVDAYFQQMWALDQCYQLVKDYEERFNVKYQLMIRTRVDILSKKQFQLERDGVHDVNKTLLAPPNRFFDALDDGFAVGPMNLMFHYMTRWNTFHQCPPNQTYHSETYLTRHLGQFTNVTRDKTLPAAADAIEHGFGSCH